MRVAIVAPSLSRDGGAERMSSSLANALSHSGHDVVLVTRNPSTFDRQPLDDQVSVRRMYVPRGPKSLKNVQLPFVIRSLRANIRGFRTDVVIGSRWDCAILSLLATAGTPIPVVAWEHGYLPLATLTPAWKTLRRLTYRRAASLVIINEASREQADRLVDPSRVHVIHNFVDRRVAGNEVEDDVERARAASLWRSFPGGAPARKLLALGRLEYEKGFDLLIDAYAKIAGDLPDWGLSIVGRGSMHDGLAKQIAGHPTLDGRVHLAGPVDDPFATLRDSDAFVLPSRHEGFGLALIEAMSSGLPAVAFDCPAGPREIIRDGVDGLLVAEGDVGALSDALVRLLSDTELRERLASNAVDVRARFSEERALRGWAALLSSAAESSPAVHHGAEPSR
jgi:glycosyltransferase involved in cell wall biosynthesis